MKKLSIILGILLVVCLVGGSILVFKQREAIYTLQGEKIAILAQLEATQDKVATITEDLKDSEMKVSQLETEVGGLETEVSRFETEVSRLEADLEEVTEDFVATKSQLLKTEGELNSCQTEVERLTNNLEAATFELGENMLVMPRDTPDFDCDDSVLYMYHYFTSMGYDVRIVFGNLDLTGEAWEQSNHTWVWVDTGIDGEIAYDWGRVYYDEQHDFGYVATYEELLRAALLDY